MLADWRRVRKMWNKKQAEKHLKVSERTLARLVQSGKLVASYQITAKGREARFDEDQVRQLKQSIDQERSVVHTPAPAGTTGSTALEKRHQQAPIASRTEILELLRTRSAPTVVLGERVWITRQEAVELSGLPRGVVYGAVREWEAQGVAIRFGRGWRIKRDAVLAWSRDYKR